MDIIAALLYIARIILGLALVLFIPGFALSWTLFPEKEQMQIITRIALSFVLSISSVMLVVIFLDMFLGIDSTPLNIVIIILVTTTIALTIWMIELYLTKIIIRGNFPARIQQFSSSLKGLFNHLLRKKSPLKK